MRHTRTFALATILGTVVVAAVAVALLSGGFAVGSVWSDDPAGELDHRWTTSIDTGYGTNHHDLAATTVDGEPVIAVPVNDLTNGEGCNLLVLGADGSERWAFDVPRDHCTPHAVGSVVAADRTGAGPEFLVATETEELIGLDSDDGAVTFRYDIGQMGFSRPLVADLTGSGTPETVVAGFSGAVHVLDDEGERLWHTELEGTTPTDPIAADLSGDGQTQLAVVQRTGVTGEVVVFDGAGDVGWRAPIDSPASSWTVVGDTAIDADATDDSDAADDAGRTTLVVSMGPGNLVALDGATGTERWTADAADSRLALASSPDGTVFAAGVGAVRAIDPVDGDVHWTQSFDGDADAAAPVVGDVTGDGDPEIAVAFRDGTVAVLDSDSGDVLALEEVDGSIYVSPLLIDLDGDGSDEVVVFIGDGRIEAYDYDTGDG